MSREKSEKNVRNVPITVRLNEEEHEKLKQCAAACGLSTAEFMHQLCKGNAPQPKPENKRRPASMFSGLLYCADCGAKLSLATANGYMHFCCSMYKRTSRAKECTQHYIREDALKQLVLKQLQQFLSYLQQFERVFIRQQIDTTLAERRMTNAFTSCRTDMKPIRNS